MYKANSRNLQQGPVAADNAINRDHPLNANRMFWGYTPTGIAASGSRLTDITGNGNHGTFVASPIWTRMPLGDMGIKFSGSTDQVNIPLSIPGPVTAACWVIITGSQNFSYIIGGDDFAGLRTTSSGVVSICDNTTDVVTTTVGLNKLVRVAGSFDGTNASLYINGTLVGQGASSRLGWNTPVLGDTETGGSSPLACIISSVTFFNIAWTPAMAAEDYAQELLGNPDTIKRFSTVTRSVSSGGGSFTASLSGSQSTSGVFTRQVLKSLAGSTAGVGSLTKQTAKALTGSFTESGALARLTAKPLAGSEAAGGVLTRASSKTLTGSEAASGTLTKQTAKSLSGSTTSSGSFSSLRVALKSLAGAISSAGSLVKAAAKSLNGSETTTGSLTKQTSRTMTGSETTSEAFAKQTDKSFAGSEAVAGSLTKQTAKHLDGTEATAATLTKQTGKSFTGSTTPSGSFAALRVVLRTFSEAIAAAGSLTRAIAKAISGATPANGGMTKLTAKSMAGSTTSSGGFVARRLVQLAFAGAVGTSSALGRAVAKVFSGTTGLLGLFTKRGGEVIVLTPGGVLRRFAGLSRRIVRTVGVSRLFRRPYAKRTFRGHTPMGQILVTSLPKEAGETVAFIFDFSKFDEAVAGETLSAPSIDAVDGLTIGSPAIIAVDTNFVLAGLGVIATISGGIAATDYAVKCRAAFSGGSNRVVEGLIQVE